MSRNAKGALKLVMVAVILAASIGTFVFGRSYTDLPQEKAPFGRMSVVPSFDPIQDVTLGVPMDSGNNGVSAPMPSIRSVTVMPTQILMRAGGVMTRVIESTSPVTSLHDLVQIVGDPDWLGESGSTITLHAAVILSVDGTMSVSAPVTTEVIMTVRQGVFLAANQAHLTLSGVNVHASDANTPKAGSATAVRKDLGRPFVLAVGSTMVISNSTFRYLGRDWNSSYGVAWSKGSTGSVSASLFENNFIGAYTDRSDGLQITNSNFFHNSLYGIDPHSYSTNLLVEGNNSSFNGRHGIIFSDHVTGGIVRNNITNGNGLNGIMMDEESSGNTIENNSVADNLSDGIVMADSGSNAILANTIISNRVGIHVRGSSSTNITATGNTVSHNSVAAQGIELTGNSVDSNGGQWQLSRIAVVWLVALVVLLVLASLTWNNPRVQRRHQHSSRAALA